MGEIIRFFFLKGKQNLLNLNQLSSDDLVMLNYIALCTKRGNIAFVRSHVPMFFTSKMISRRLLPLVLILNLRIYELIKKVR